VEVAQGVCLFTDLWKDGEKGGIKRERDKGSAKERRIGEDRKNEEAREIENEIKKGRNEKKKGGQEERKK
jgi:hypothetical protein